MDSEVKVLKSEFLDLITKYDDLSAKYVILEKKHDGCISSKQMFRCEECDEEFSDKNRLRRHIKNP